MIRTALVLVVCLSPFAKSALAGDVVAENKNGKVVVTGSDGADALSFQIVGTGFQLTPGAGTTVNGAIMTFEIPAPTKDVLVDLKDGNDVLTCVASSYPRGMRVKLGGGEDIITIAGTFERGVRIDGGPGADTIAAGGVTTGKDFVVDGGAEGCEVNLQGMTIEENLTVRLRTLSVPAATQTVKLAVVHGAFTLSGRNTGAVAFMNSSVSERVRISLADESIPLALQFLSLGSSLGVNVNGDCGATLANSSAPGDVSFRSKGPNFGLVVSQATLSGDFRERSECATATLGFSGSSVNGDFAVRHDSTGPSAVAWSAGSGIHGDVSIRCGKGPDTLTLSQTAFDGDVDVDLGAGDDFVSVTQLTCGRTRFDGGGGTNQLESSLSHWDRFEWRGGPGRDDLLLSGDEVKGDANFLLASGMNRLSLETVNVNADLTVRCGDDADVLTFADLFVGGKKSIKTGGGADTGP